MIGVQTQGTAVISYRTCKMALLLGVRAEFVEGMRIVRAVGCETSVDLYRLVPVAALLIEMS